MADDTQAPNVDCVSEHWEWLPKEVEKSLRRMGTRDPFHYREKPRGGLTAFSVKRQNRIITFVLVSGGNSIRVVDRHMENGTPCDSGKRKECPPFAFEGQTMFTVRLKFQPEGSLYYQYDDGQILLPCDVVREGLRPLFQEVEG